MKRRKMSSKYSPALKFRVALAALKGNKTIAELCQEFGVASSLIYAWKKDLEERGLEIFETKSPEHSHRVEVDKLHGVIGKLKVENNFLERALGSSH
ncbi:transposase [Candidatus Neptunichlamydia sp. REUL1]|uniref:transposase n=1 Tax=Candidatus Neptunichlamydia sp. REUL1 TaxID=3064277 RepID=UPI00292E0E3C|nr:transposase [Candidatus Neptunochlamydia sp. REUL1]